MKVRLLFFAVLRDIIGCTTEELAIESGTTPNDVWQSLRRAHPPLQSYAQPPMVAINQEYARPDQALREGDELAFIPPVAGG